MKKILIVVMIIFSASLYSNKANAQLEQGSIIIEGYYGYSLTNAWWTAVFDIMDDEVATKSIGPLGLRFEYLISDIVGVGLDINYRGFEASYNYPDFNNTVQNVSWNITQTRIMGRMNFHFVKEESFNAYAGYGIGYKISSMTLTTTDASVSDDDVDLSSFNIPIAFRVSTGVRYFFTENIGVHVEVGIGGGSLANGGLSFKL